jgi:hypothetical protein
VVTGIGFDNYYDNTKILLDFVSHLRYESRMLGDPAAARSYRGRVFLPEPLFFHLTM